MIDNKVLALQDKEAYEILQKERRREEDTRSVLPSSYLSLRVLTSSSMV